MFETGSWFWRWLAEQPPFIEVGIGMFFVLVLAPATLVSVAIAATRVEAIAGTIAVRFFNLDRKAAATGYRRSRIERADCCPDSD